MATKISFPCLSTAKRRYPTLPFTFSFPPFPPFPRLSDRCWVDRCSSRPLAL